DGIHFILSLGIECGFDEKIFDLKNIPSSNTITEQFLQIYQLVGTFKKSRELSDYIAVFECYLQLADLLGLTYEEIKTAYIKKNEVNYKRQNNNY
ncbi:MAG TPA: dUTP diphosphatase, partial [Bacillales bacterium]|nr:dUTP diphosphatase [Bacillales bacterium]